MTIGSVLFDLDGTLADTAPDLAWTLNQTLQRQGREPLPYGTIRPHVSNGAEAMIRAGFGIDSDHKEYQALRNFFMQTYQDNICRQTTLFTGMAQVLEQLEQRDIPWGIVTNKPAYLTDPLVAALGLLQRAACVISGDTLAHSKPHPAPILHGCRLTHTDPGHCLYVGDAERDIQAGRAAGTRTLAALYGYLHQDDEPDTWGADDVIKTPVEILDHI